MCSGFFVLCMDVAVADVFVCGQASVCSRSRPRVWSIGSSEPIGSSESLRADPEYEHTLA